MGELVPEAMAVLVVEQGNFPRRLGSEFTVISVASAVGSGDPTAPPDAPSIR